MSNLSLSLREELLRQCQSFLYFLNCFFRCSYVTAITIWWPTTKSFNEMILNVNRSCWSTATNAKRVFVVKIRVVSTNVKNMFQVLLTARYFLMTDKGQILRLEMCSWIVTPLRKGSDLEVCKGKSAYE